MLILQFFLMKTPWLIPFFLSFLTTSVPLILGTQYLKGRLMELSGKYTNAEISKQYELATKLAPGNPFGAWGYFCEDEQRSAADSEKDTMESYKKLAIKWGAAEKIDL
jgi:hypothetical protein